MERIEIDRLVIRLRHIEPRMARRAMDGLGRELGQALVSRGGDEANGHIRLHQIDLGLLSSSAEQGAAGIRQQVSRAVSEAIQTKRTGGQGE